MATVRLARDRRRGDHLFFTGMALFAAAIVFAGFARSYYLSPWLTPPSRTPEITPLLHIHALVFTLWIALIVMQPALIAGGKVALHRRLGAGGAVLAGLVWALGNLAAIEAIKVGYKGLGDPYAFYAITFFSIQAFGIIVALGVIWRRKVETHKRLMLLSNAAILEAAVGRLPLDLIESAAPFSFYLGGDLIILAGATYDLATRHRVHPVWLWGGGALITSQFLRVAIMDKGPWLAFARAMADLL
jgi:uncharacterized membrane protein YozB (DUF420 family)